ncbi:hypothetical protein ACJZ2D_011841 [Fusarium nematophilum]
MDPLSISASGIAIATAAIQSTRSLKDTITRFKERDKTLARLQHELEDLSNILNVLKGAFGSGVSTMAHIEGPVSRCNQICREFDTAMQAFSRKSKIGIRDWTKMEFMKGDINEFMDTLAGYKATISVSLGTITMQTSTLSNKVLEEYNEMIRDIIYNLCIRLQRIDEKIALFITESSGSASTSDTSIDLIDERAVTEQCLRICQDASSYIESLAQSKGPQKQPLVNEPARAYAQHVRQEPEEFLRTSQNGDIEAVQAFLEKGANIMIANEEGWTPLHLASMNGHVEVVKALLDKGADVLTNCGDGLGTILNSEDSMGRAPLSWAAANGREAVVSLLLDTNKIRVDSRDNDGQTPLSLAATNGHNAVAKMLLDSGKADIAAKDACGLTALQLAAFNRHTGMEDLLIARRAPIVPDFYGLQALFKEPVGMVESTAAVSQCIPIQPPQSDEPRSPKVDNTADNLEYDILLTRGFLPIVQDLSKRAIERIAGCRLSWWPLSDPEEGVKPGYTRVYSMSFAKSSQRDQRFYDDIPTPLVETMFPKIIDVRSSVPRSRWTALSSEAILLRDTTPMRLLQRWGNDKTRQQQNHQPERRRPGEAKGTEGDDQGGQDPDDLSVLEGDSQNSSKSQPILFISADIRSNESVAGTLALGENDEITFRNLRTAFRDLPSQRWKRATGMKFYRFRSFHFKHSLRRRYVVIDKDKERYPEEAEPEYRNYNYNPRPWEDGKPCPCLSGEAWFFFNNPDECCNSRELNHALPVRLNDTSDSRITAWGVHIEQRHSVLTIFIPTIALTLVTLAGTFWFIPQWLKDHPGDLQNATVPVTLGFTVIQFLIQLLVSLLIFRWCA